jgi:hypothetical protein
MKTWIQRPRAALETMLAWIQWAVNPPLGPDAPPVEIKEAIVEAVERDVQPFGRTNAPCNRSAAIAAGCPAACSR